MMPAAPSVADAVAESRRLLKRAEHFSDSTDGRAQTAAQMATGHVLLAIGEEIATVRAQLDQLAGIRLEVAGLAGAVRELTATVAKTAEPLAEAARAVPDIATAVRDAPDHGDVMADIATAVESLVCAVDRPRRSWFRRRSGQVGEVSA
jgi:hypothetical protein